LKKQQLLLSVAALAIVYLFGGATYAKADNDFIVYSPYIAQGRSEIEMYGFGYRDGRSELNGKLGYNISVAYAVTSWWKPELYIGQFNRDNKGVTRQSGYELENTFAITNRGEYWADLGFLASYIYNKQRNVPNRVEFGPLFEKWSGHINQRLNLIWEKEVGGGAGKQFTFRSAYSVSYKINFNKFAISPGIEAYYRPNDNAYQIGPVLYGEIRSDTGRELEYSIGIIAGINHGAPDQTLLFRLEYEFF